MNKKKTVASLGGDPIYARVCEKLREEILTGVFAAGVRLKIVELSERYNVSMMPVREALQQLQGEGLIILEPYNGARVRGIDQRFIRNMYDIRSVIDGMLMGKVATLATAEEIRAAAAINEEYEEAVRQGEGTRALERNKQFHRLLYQLADNPEALNIIDRHWGLIDCLRRKFHFGSGRAPVAIREHKLLLKALLAHNAAEAEQIARRHSAEAKDDLLRQMQETADAEAGRSVKSPAGASLR